MKLFSKTKKRSRKLVSFKVIPRLKYPTKTFLDLYDMISNLLNVGSK